MKDIDTASAQADWNDTALAAARRAMEEGGFTETELAAQMGYREQSVLRLLAGGARWSLDAVLRLAAVTRQHPGRMLGRESLP